MESRKTLQTYFDKGRERLDYIAKYEENKIFFNELLQTGRKEDLEFVLPIKLYKYASSLNSKGNYSKALEVLFEIETDLKKLQGISKRHKQLHESLIFLKGACYGHLKKYNRSNVEFKKILKLNPTNDNYMDWYKSNLTNIIDNYIKIGIAVSFMCYALTVAMNLLAISYPSYLHDLSLIFVLVSCSCIIISAKTINKLYFKLRKNW